MRLLEVLSSHGIRLTEYETGTTIPRYAILSHRWEAAGQEVTFEDLLDGSAQDKEGYRKIQFCTQQAIKDGLQYFWVDSCCIKRSSDAELSESLNSMFRWYQHAEKCYVFLSDVSTRDMCEVHNEGDDAWKQSFRKSKWFTRGWTLQELLAPELVEFYSADACLLGDKQSLAEQIHEITKIPLRALRATSLSRFDVDQKFRWTEGRRTTRPEDMAYCLLGIFDVSMAVRYGEGQEQALVRLRRKIDKRLRDKEILQHLYVTDPSADKIRIEDAKGGLIRESYNWILQDGKFKQWREDREQHLLWIKGDPGKGKTMMLCGIVDELETLKSKTDLLSFFFCQATDQRINSATAVLRGLLYALVAQQPELLSHIQKRHDYTGQSLFQDVNAWVALAEIFTDVLEDPYLDTKDTYLIIDALDECTVDLPKLLDFIVHKSSSFSRVKWLVSSRKWPDVERQLDKVGGKLTIELSPQSISAAVKIYIEHKVAILARERKYDGKTQEAVLDHLISNADNTFLWVALVCQHLEKIMRWQVKAQLKALPPGLNSLYARMMHQVSDSEYSDLCMRILATVSVVYEPITLVGLASLIEVLEEAAEDLESLSELVRLCGSFLIVRDSTIYFVHQSAKDFLLKATEIFHCGQQEVHYEIFTRSLRVMMSTLRRDIYELGAPGCSIEQADPPNPDPLAASRYCCVYWINHLNDCSSHFAKSPAELQEGAMVDTFLREKYLYWLEALSLCSSMLSGVIGMAKLEALIKTKVGNSALLALAQDARRFIMYARPGIEASPLQTYVSAIAFSPGDSLTRHNFQTEQPEWMMLTPIPGGTWDPCLQTLHGHGRFISSVAFSRDSNRLASASDDCTIKVWDANGGAHERTLKGHTDHVRSVAFSSDSTLLASGSSDRTLKIWDVRTGECVQTFNDHAEEAITCIALSHDSTRLASGSDDANIRIWDIGERRCLWTLKGHTDHVNSIAFSHESTRLLSASSDRTVKLWDANTGDCLQTLKGHSGPVSAVAFSHDSALIASSSQDRTIRTWNASSGKSVRTFVGHGDDIPSIVFSTDSNWLASASQDSTIRIWDTFTGACLQKLIGHTDRVTSVAFSAMSTRLASASWDCTIRIWSTHGNEQSRTQKGHSHSVNWVTFSDDLSQLASGAKDCSIRLWDAGSVKHLRKLKGHENDVRRVVFSHDSARVASASWDCTLRTWDTASGNCLQDFVGHDHWVTTVAFSHDSAQLASASLDKTVRIWDATTGKCLKILKGHQDEVTVVAFSQDSSRLVSGSFDHTCKIWDIRGGRDPCIQTLQGHSDHVHSVAISHDSTRVASASQDRTIKIWDANTGECIRTLNVGRFAKGIHKLAFSVGDQNLHTDIGVIALDVPLASSMAQDQAEHQLPRYVGVGLSPNGDWITYNSEKLVWIPFDYRPWCSTVLDKTIVIGSGSGKVWMCCISPGRSKRAIPYRS